MRYELRHITMNGEGLFAIVRGSEVAKVLRGCVNWSEARVEYRAFVRQQGA
jgi:hypothetical protein